jgi:hypothetical protein
VVILLLFLGFMAFTVDMGFWLLDRRGGQNQVDASVLAGVQELPAPADALVPAANAAQDCLERNSRTDQGQVISECGMDEDDGYDELESPASAPESDFAFADRNDDGLYDTIRACIRREGLVIFARLFDLVGVTIPAVAAAGVQTEDEPSRYALMAMNDSNCDDVPPSLHVRGEANVTLRGKESLIPLLTAVQRILCELMATETSTARTTMSVATAMTMTTSREVPTPAKGWSRTCPRKESVMCRTRGKAMTRLRRTAPRPATAQIPPNISNRRTWVTRTSTSCRETTMASCRMTPLSSSSPALTAS